MLWQLLFLCYCFSAPKFIAFAPRQSNIGRILILTSLFPRAFFFVFCSSLLVSNSNSQLSTQLEAEQDMLKLEKARVLELEGQMKQMSIQLDQHEMALHQQMEQQRLRWKSEIVSSNSMLNTVGRCFMPSILRSTVDLFSESSCGIIRSDTTNFSKTFQRKKLPESRRVKPNVQGLVAWLALSKVLR